jgi:RNA-directed DNA polymerase
MLAPQPGRSEHFPKPTKIISKAALYQAWNRCRDATTDPGRPGINGVSAIQFAAKLDSNLAEIARRLKQGSYGFSGLHAVFVPKPNSDKDRMICIPTVQDRLVQRVILEYITRKKLFPIYNSSSFGFIRGRGPREAIQAAIKLREKYAWCLKTDIESFFDKIPRRELKRRLRRHLKKCSVTPLICSAVDCEVKVTKENRRDLSKQSVKPGIGVRQGMPLSPLLANLILADFDRQVSVRKIEMIRYADDIALFFENKGDAKNGEAFVREELKRIQLTIPKIADGSKTEIVSSSNSLFFLGREIVRLGREGCFIARVPDKQIKKIKASLLEKFSFVQSSKSGKNFQDTIVDLSKSISAYLGIYKDAYNYDAFEGELRGHARAIIAKIFKDIFGEESLASLTDDSRKFLGLKGFDEVKPNPELDTWY